MTAAQEIYINALLADASYVDVTAVSNLSVALKDRMTQTLANLIGANFGVHTSVTTPGIIGSAFDATVWKGKAGTDYDGKVYISMRGTQGGTDLLNDVDLALGGPAGNQIVDMANWWLKITTPAGQQARQIVVHSVQVSTGTGEATWMRGEDISRVDPAWLFITGNSERRPTDFVAAHASVFMVESVA